MRQRRNLHGSQKLIILLTRNFYIKDLRRDIFFRSLGGSHHKTGQIPCWWAWIRGSIPCPRVFKTDISPSNWAGIAKAYARFCREVIDVVAPLVPAVKPQAAFFEQLGPAGMECLGRGDRLRPAKGAAGDSRRQAERHRLDGHGLRPGDFGSGRRTDRPRKPLGGRCPDRQPLPGRRQPAAVRRRGRRARGGHLRAGEDLESRRRHVSGSRGRRPAALSPRGRIRRTQSGEERRRTCGYGLVGAVVGATYPQQLAELARGHAAHRGFWCPASAAKAARPRDVAAAFDADGLGAIVNNSRGIIFAHVEQALRRALRRRHAGKRRSRPPRAT